MSDHTKLNCREAFSRLDDYLDRELSAEELEAVRLHLEACAHCAQVFGFEANLIQALRQKLCRIDAPCDLKKRVYEAIMGSIEEKG